MHVMSGRSSVRYCKYYERREKEHEKSSRIINGCSYDSRNGNSSICCSESGCNYRYCFRGNKVEVTVSDNFTAAEQPAVNEIKKDAAAVLEEVVPAVNAADYKLATVKEVTVPAGTVFPVKITFNVDGVTAGSKVIVLHYVNGAWQQESVVAGNGTITVTLNSLSPIAIYVEANGAVAGNGNGSATGTGANGTNGAKLSPKTGAAPTMTFVVVIAAAAVAGMCVTAKKKNA